MSSEPTTHEERGRAVGHRMTAPKIGEADMEQLLTRDPGAGLQELARHFNNLADRYNALEGAAGAADLQHQQQQQRQQQQQLQLQQQIEERDQDRFTRSLSSLPKFSGKETWRCWSTSYENWLYANNLENIGDERIKNSILLAFRDEALRRIAPYRRDTEAWVQNPTWRGYLQVLRGAFLPTQEGDLAKIEYKARKQGRLEPITSFLNDKIALADIAYGETLIFENLVDDVIEATYNNVVKKKIRTGHPADIQQLVNIAVTAVADERRGVEGNYGEGTTLDGLAAVTVLSGQDGSNYRAGQGETPMDIGFISPHKPPDKKGKCNRCHKAGHFARECYAKRTAEGRVLDPSTAAVKPRSGRGGPSNKGNSNHKGNNANKGRGNSSMICYNCSKPGHKAQDCRAPKSITIQEIGEEEEEPATFLGARALRGPEEEEEW